VLALSLAVALDVDPARAEPPESGSPAPAEPAPAEEPVRAAPRPTDDAQGVPIENIEVTARPFEEPEDVTAFATIVPIEEQPEEFKTVAQVLAETVGIQVRRFGGLGDFTTVSIRGSTPGQVRFFFDGVPLTRARSETVNLSDLPLDPLAKIEIYRGVSPLSVGATALGGIINLVTKDPDEPGMSVLAGGGSFGTRKATLLGSGRQGDFAALASFSYLGSNGDFPFDDDNGTPENPFDDERVDRQNNEFNSGDALLKGIYDLSRTARLIALNELFVNQQGVPGIGAFQSLDANVEDLRNLSYVRLEADGVSDLEIDLDSTLYFLYEEEQFEDLRGEIGTGNQQSRNRTFSPGFFTHGFRPLGTHLLEGRIDLGGEIFVPRDLLSDDPAGPDQSRFNFAAGVGDTVDFFQGSLVLEGQLRYELAVDDFGGILGPDGHPIDSSGGATSQLFTPHAGARIDVWDDLWVKTNVGRYGRIPSFFELFGNRGSVVGNPDLQPEEGLNVDAGFDFVPARLGPLTRLRGEAVFFYRDVDDLIVLVQNSQRVSVPQNVGSAEILGAELSLRFRAWERLGLIANYTYQDARDTSDVPSRRGNQLPGRPLHEAYARAEYHWEGWMPFYELSFTSGNFLDQANLQEVESSAVHTLGLQYALPRWPVTLTFEARNFTDDQVEDFGGFPLPGLTFFGTVAYRWPPPEPQEETG
jgi:outer membrane receptor protein involved in Fe transport